jgi:hypothetical protein
VGTAEVGPQDDGGSDDRRARHQLTAYVLVRGRRTVQLGLV